MTDKQQSINEYLAWSRIWSPVVPSNVRHDAFEILQMPIGLAAEEAIYWKTFHLDLPAPLVSLLFHAAFNQDGGNIRETWMRVMTHLEMTYDQATLPPDHLAIGCEIMAVCIDQEETVMIDELSRRFLLPWCELAVDRLSSEGIEENQSTPMINLVKRFEQTVRQGL